MSGPEAASWWSDNWTLIQPAIQVVEETARYAAEHVGNSATDCTEVMKSQQTLEQLLSGV